MFVESRDEAREFFFAVRRKMRTGSELEPIEAVLASVIERHPEYHAVLDRPEAALTRDFDGSDGAPNPFFHMGLHIALIEQLQTDRPSGVREVYQQLVGGKAVDAHAAEHRMMDCLADMLWDAGRSGRPPDETVYIERLRRLT